MLTELVVADAALPLTRVQTPHRWLCCGRRSPHCYVETDCAICSEGYTAQFGFVCNKCSSSTAGIVLAAFLAVVAALIVAVAVVSYATSGEGNGKGQGLVERVARYIPLQSVKIVIVVWQILTQVHLARHEDAGVAGH